MKTRALLLTLIAVFIYHLSGAQQLESFQGRLKKRAPINQLRDKTYQPQYPASPITISPQHRTCATMETDAALRAQYPQMGSLEEHEIQFGRLVEAYKNQASRGPQEVITIPVIVHVVHNGQGVGTGPNISRAQVQSQIDALNEDFRRTGGGFNNHPAGADVEIQFALALVNPQGAVLPEPGIDRVNGGRSFWEVSSLQNTLKQSTQWDPLRYCNIWTVQFGGENEDLLGYAQFPSLSGLPGMQQNEGLAKTDGVVIRWQSFGRSGNVQAPYDRGRTTTHEIGHWLGLRHIWGDGGCNVDDFCNDTPPAGQPNTSCVAINSCPGGDNDMIENYMDYTTDACMNIFTQDQKARIRTVINVSPRRKELRSSSVAESGGVNPNAPVADFSMSTQGACSGSTIQFTDQSSNSPASWEWEFFDDEGNSLATFQGQNQSITFNTPGMYGVQLTVSNSAGSDASLMENSIFILSSTEYQEFNEDAENLNTAFQDWVFYNPDADRTFQPANVSSYGEGSHSVLFDNYSTDDDPSGTIDALISPGLDLSSTSNPYFYFEHAYAQYGGQYSDTLVLYYSLDCGATFQPFWYKGGDELATAPATEDYFTPNANQWSWNQISLSFLAGQPSVHIVVANLSGWGNNLYLDQIAYIDGLDYTNGPAAPDFYAARQQVCAGDVVQFQDYSSNFPTQWGWQFEGGNPASSNFQHPFVQYNTPGTYDVQLSSGNSFGGNSAFAANYIEVVPLPEIEVFVDQNSICGGEPFTLTATGANTYEWFDERSGTQVFEGAALTLTLFENWTFTVVGKNSLGCESAATFEVPVNNLPTPTITVQGASLVASAAPGYQWYLNGNPVPAGQGGMQQVFQPQATGNYQLEVFDANGCAALSNTLFFELPTGTRAVEDISQTLRAFPNPTKGELRLEMVNETRGAFQLEIRDILGKVVYRQPVVKNTDNWAMDVGLEGLPAGTYVIQLKHERFQASRRVVKQ